MTNINISVSSDFKNEIFPAGKYWIGDPCYIFPDELWSRYCNLSFGESKGCSHDIAGGITFFGNSKFFSCTTSFGDGEYPIFKRNRAVGHCGVDAGLLALIPINLAATWPEWDEKMSFGVFVKVDSDFKIEVFGNKSRPGNWKFDDFSVITS